MVSLAEDRIARGRTRRFRPASRSRSTSRSTARPIWTAGWKYSRCGMKELNGRPTDVSPSGAATRDSTFVQSYRAELAHFLSVLREESPYEPPVDQSRIHKLLEMIYRAGEEGREVRA